MNEEVKFALERAKAALISRDYEQAVKVLKNLLKKQPEALEALAVLGSVYIRNGKLSEAKETYEKILELDTNNIDAINNLGVIYRRLKRYEDSLKVLQSVVDLGNESDTVYYNLGSTYKEMNKMKEAAECFEVVLNNKPDDVLAYNHLGKIYAAAGENEKAMHTYMRGLQVDPNHPILHYNMAQVLEADGKKLEAEGAYLSALRSKPGWIEAMQSYAALLRSLNRHGEAEDMLQQALKINDKNTTVLAELADMYAAKEKFEDAKGLYHKAVKIDENAVPALIGLEKVHEKQGNFDAALKTIKKLESIQPENDDILLQYAKLLLKLDSPDEALKRILKVLKKDDSHIDALRLQGRYYVQKGEGEKAQDCFSKILSIDPKNTEFHMDMAEQCISTKDYMGAEKHLCSYLAMNPKDIGALLALGQVYEALKNVEKAVECYRKILRLNNKSAEVMTAISRLFNENGQNAQAIRLFEELTNTLSSVISEEDLKSFSTSLGEYEKALQNFEKHNGNRIEKNLRKLKTQPSEVGIDEISPIAEESEPVREKTIDADSFFDELLFEEEKDEFGEEIPLDMFLSSEPLPEPEENDDLEMLVDSGMPIEEDQVVDEGEEEETVQLDPQEESFLGGKDKSDELKLEEERAVAQEDEIEPVRTASAMPKSDFKPEEKSAAEHTGELEDDSQEERGEGIAAKPAEKNGEHKPDSEGCVIEEPAKTPAEKSGEHKADTEERVIAESAKSAGKADEHKNEFPDIDLAEELSRVSRDNPYFEVIEMLIFLKYLVCSLPYHLQKEFFSSSDRLQLEYIIEKLIGRRGLLQDVCENNNEVSIDGKLPEDMNSFNSASVSNTLDYLRGLAQDLPDRYLATALETKVDGILSRIKGNL